NKKQLLESWQEAVERVKQRTFYGLRDVKIEEDKWFELTWSNAGVEWWSMRDPVDENPIRLDANQIIVRADTKDEANTIAKYLPTLPLYHSSFEAKGRGGYNREMHLRALTETIERRKNDENNN
ncbi:MAG: hypothetical protein U9N73_10240, partial [Candidatus Auribacterota bacterium]|nr:hypothetical protein [Candidatus Auribacterota bacterium]